MSAYQLAQVNIARPLAPIGSAPMQEFVDNLDPVNAVADASPGCVWRLQTPEGNATSLHVFGDAHLPINMSVWETVEARRDFVQRGDAHRTVRASRICASTAHIGRLHVPRRVSAAGPPSRDGRTQNRLVQRQRQREVAQRDDGRLVVGAPRRHVVLRQLQLHCVTGLQLPRVGPELEAHVRRQRQ